MKMLLKLRYQDFHPPEIWRHQLKQEETAQKNQTEEWEWPCSDIQVMNETVHPQE